jgi:hypothetical protein
MIQFSTRVLEACLDIRQFKVRQFFDNLLGAESSGKQVQNVHNPDPQPPDAWPSAALVRVYRDSIHDDSLPLPFRGCTP